MSWLMDDAELLLSTHGYSTVRMPGIDALAFEDEVVLGFVLEYTSVADLAAKWAGDQLELLKRLAPALRVSRDKSWNVYLVLLTSARPLDENERFQLDLIEADLSSTRKLPRASVATPADLRAALNALLPISNRAEIQQDAFSGRVSRRIADEVGEEVSELFVGQADEGVVAQALIETVQ